MTWPTASERELSGQWKDNVYPQLYHLIGATGTYTDADSKLNTGNGLRQHAPHHLEEPAPDTGQPAV